jgi:4-hydroxyphenylpyruvate dioxygenase
MGLRVGFEALAWGRHVNDHRDAWEVVRRADHPIVGLILDSFHTLARKIDPVTIRRIPGDKIFFVQLADAPRSTWTCSTGRAISATCRARAIWM